MAINLPENFVVCYVRFNSKPDFSVMFDSLFSERGLSLDRLKVLIKVRDAGSIAQAAPGDPVRQSLSLPRKNGHQFRRL
jgi:hypothetical protein